MQTLQLFECNIVSDSVAERGRMQMGSRRKAAQQITCGETSHMDAAPSQLFYLPPPSSISFRLS